MGYVPGGTWQTVPKRALCPFTGNPSPSGSTATGLFTVFALCLCYIALHCV